MTMIARSICIKRTIKDMAIGGHLKYIFLFRCLRSICSELSRISMMDSSSCLNGPRKFLITSGPW